MTTPERPAASTTGTWGALAFLAAVHTHQRALLASWPAIAWERDVGCCQDHSDWPDTLLDAQARSLDALVEAWVDDAVMRTDPPAGELLDGPLRAALATGTPPELTSQDPVIAWVRDVAELVDLRDVLRDYRSELQSGTPRIGMRCEAGDGEVALNHDGTDIHVRAFNDTELDALTTLPALPSI